MKKYTFLDVETTGLSPYNGDRMIEIGCVEVFNNFITGRVYHTYFNTNAIISEEAYQIHGIDNYFLKNKPLFCEKIDEILGFMNNTTIIAHNAKFDINFLNYEINKCGGETDIFFRKNMVLDSLEIARKMFPKKKNDLNSLCKRFNINISLREKHNALFDAWLLAIVSMRMKII